MANTFDDTQPKLLIIIPAYNEAENIERVVDNLTENYPQWDYLVVNDGSKDRTAEICREKGYPLLDLPVNLGLAGAFQDGDGQHEPAYIAAMLQKMEEEKLDIVIGSRFCEEKKPHTLRMLGSTLITWAIRLTTGRKVSDPTSGMRLFSSNVLKNFSSSINYGPEPDTVSYLLRCGASISEVQVEMHERIAGTSYLNLGRSVRYMLNMFVSILFVQFFRPRGAL